MGDVHIASVVLTGVDGSVWHLAGAEAWTSPVQIREGSLGDFLDVPVNTSRKSVVGKPGTKYLGSRVLERNIEIPVFVKGSTLEAFTVADSGFRKALDYDRAARLAVTTQESGERWIDVRLAEQFSFEGEYDPHVDLKAKYTVSLVADDPLWRSETAHSEFVFDGLNWFDGTVRISNPTDVPVWPKWVLTSPAKWILPDPDVKSSDFDRTIVLPFQPFGHEVVVDTDPTVEMVTDTQEALLWAQMNGQFFNFSIPPRTPPIDIPVAVDPLPLLANWIPDEGRKWFARRMKWFAELVGLDTLIRMTPEELGEEMAGWIRDVTPDWIEGLVDWLLPVLSAENIANAIVEQWGSVANMAGATAQVRLERQWTRPWGLE
ncbi:phage tail domain-containing protein [Corynebacterium kalidii]